MTKGFGYNPEHEVHHFEVVKRGDLHAVAIYECYAADRFLKAYIPEDVFAKIAPAAAKVFNERLPKKGSFKSDALKLSRLLGKELVVLMWAVEHLDVDYVPNAIDSWLRLSKEERWWLYTMAANDVNWRLSLRVSLGGATIASH